MRSPGISTLILVGLTATAAAQPKQEETSGRVSLKEDDARRKARDSQAPRAPADWVELATPTPASHGTEFVMVGKDAGGFGKLRLDAVKGVVPVKTVRVVFTDGTAKSYRLGKRLDAKRQPSLYVDLPTTATIEQIVVTTDPRARGEYAVYGSGTGGVVADR